MKTKIFFIALFTAIFGFAAQAQAQDAIKFINIQQTNGQVRAQIYCSAPVTIYFGIAASWSGTNPLSFTFKLGPQMVYDLNQGSRGYTVTLSAGYNDVYGYITGTPGQYSYPQGNIYISHIVSGNAVLDKSGPLFLNFTKS